jgi:hypothetical protein
MVMKKNVQNFVRLTIKSLVRVLVLAVVFCSTTVYAASQYDTFVDGWWNPALDEWATGRVVVSGRTVFPAGANAIVSIFGGELHDVDLNNGCMTLGNDLVISGSLISTDGTITNSLSHNIIILFSKNQTFTTATKITFTGDITLDCNGHDFDLDSTSTFSIGDATAGGNTLTLRNMTLKGLHDTNSLDISDDWLVFNHDDSRLVFDNVKIDGPLYLNQQQLQKVSGDFEFI